MTEIEKHLNWQGLFSKLEPGKTTPDLFLQRHQTNPIRDTLKSIIVTYLVKQKMSSIMEVGFGSGYEYERLEKSLKLLDVRYIGVDYTKAFVDTARENYPDVWWVWGDVRRLEFKDDSMDLIFLCHVLEHQNGLPDLTRAIRELCRVSKSVVMIVWFVPPSLTNKTTYFMDGDFFVYNYSIQDVANIIIDSGFMIKEISWQNLQSKNNCLWVLEKKELNK